MCERVCRAVNGVYDNDDHRTEEFSKRVADRDRVLLQSHLATAQKLLSSGVKPRTVKSAREEMSKHLEEARLRVRGSTSPPPGPLTSHLN